MANKISLKTNGNVWELVLDGDPRLNTGFQAPLGSYATDQATGNEYIKLGPNATDWQNLATDEEVAGILLAYLKRDGSLPMLGNLNMDSFNIVNTALHSYVENINPATPANGGLTFLRNVGGRQMLAFLGKSGLDYIIQPHLAKNKSLLWQANGNATSSTVFGGVFTNQGTASTRNVATTNFFSHFRRLGLVSANTAGSSSGIRSSSLQYCRGGGAGVGGFHFITRFGISDASAVAGARTFVGLTATTGVLGNAEPSTFSNMIGVGNDSADSNLQLYRNDGAGTATKIDLGNDFPANTRSTDMYELVLFCPPSGSTIFYQVTNLRTNIQANGSFGDNIPANNQLLAMQLWRNNNGTALAVALDVVSIYMETDF